MPNSTLAKKLLIKPGHRVAVFNAPPGYLDELTATSEAAVVADPPDGSFDVVHLFVGDVEELNRLGPTAIGASKPDAVIWISYPKQSSKRKSNLTRDVGWDSIHEAGLIGVSLVSIDEVWSAMRFRPAERYSAGQRA